MPAIGESFVKLDPRVQMRNPVMFIVEVGALVTIFYAFRDARNGQASLRLRDLGVAVVHGAVRQLRRSRGRRPRQSASRVPAAHEDRHVSRAVASSTGDEERIAAAQLRRGDRVVAEADELIPTDGDIVEGAATVDESAITGESAPVIREAGGDRTPVTGGTRVLSDRIVYASAPTRASRSSTA